MTRDEIIEWAISKGWTQDKYGNLRKEWKGNQYRLKFGVRVLRCEVRVKLSDKLVWVRLSSGRYSCLIAKDGKIYGMIAKL